MRELMWPPRVVAALTLTQLACLCSEHPPGSRAGKLATWEEMAAALAEQEREAARWASPRG